MTCIVGVKGANKKSTIISDIRLTDEETGEQNDSALKFIQFDNRISLYMSGNVFLLGEIKNELKKCKDNLTFENCDSTESPLINCIADLFKNFNFQPLSKAGFICVYGDADIKSHKIFRFDLQLKEKEWVIINLTPDANFKWEVIGSGRAIANRGYFPKCISFELDKVFNSLLTQGEEITEASFVLKREITRRLDKLNAGPIRNLYSVLGISPIFCTAVAQEEDFVMGLVEEETVSIENGKMKRSKYVMEPSRDGGVKFINVITYQETTAYQTTLYNALKISKQPKFDPEGKE
jgi:hypothetical protein